MNAPTALVVDAFELRGAMDRAATAYVNAIGADLPPISWSMETDIVTRRLVLDGLVSDCDYTTVDDRLSVAQQWTERLGLLENDAPIPGTREWIGEALRDGSRMASARVWFIVDRAAFGAA